MFPIQSYSYVKLHITGRYKESIKLYLITLTQQGSTNDDHSILEMIGFEFDYFVFNCVFILSAHDCRKDISTNSWTEMAKQL